MVTDLHIQRLRRFEQQGWSKRQAAAKAGIDEKTARKYRRLGRLPSEVRMEHTWRTRPDPFAAVWPRVEAQLTLNPGLLAKTVFAWLQAQYPGRFADGQLRTLQRRIKQWRAVQEEFVDDPTRAVSDADKLIQSVMETRGYPVGDFNQRVDDLSVAWRRDLRTWVRGSPDEPQGDAGVALINPWPA